MARNDDIAALIQNGRKAREVSSMYNITPNRVYQIYHACLSKKEKKIRLEQCRAKIRSNPDMSKKWDLSEILQCLDLQNKIHQSIQENVKNKQVSLTDFMDLLISKNRRQKDLCDRIPAYRIKNIGGYFLNHIIEQINDCRFSKEFDTEWKKRVKKAKRDLR